MKTKRFLILLAVIAQTMVIGLSACGKDTPSEPEDSGSSVSDVTNGQETTAAEGEGETQANETGGSSTGDSGLIIATSPKTNATTTQATAAQTTAGSKKDPYANIPESLKGKTVKLLLWYTPLQYEIDVMEAFKKKTGINYKYTSTGGTDLYTTKLSSAIAAGDSPDIAVMFSFAYPTLITKNLVQSIDAGKFDLTDPAWSKDQMDVFSWNGVRYGVNIKGNFHDDPYCVYYNKDMFNAKGLKTPTQLWKEGNWNWDTMLDAAQKLTTESAGKKVWGYTSAKIYQFMLSNNTDFAKFENGKIINNMSDPKALSAWQFFADTVHKYKVNPGWKDYAFFTSGQCAMYSEISYGMQKGSFMKDMKDNWGVVPFPGPKGQEYVLPSDAKGFSLAKGSKAPEAAAYFLRYWLDPANMDIDSMLIRKEDREVFNALVNSKKKVMLSRGIISFSKNFNDFTNSLYNHPSDQTASVLATWSSHLNTCIRNVTNEMPK